MTWRSELEKSVLLQIVDCHPLEGEVYGPDDICPLDMEQAIGITIWVPTGPRTSRRRFLI